MDLDFFIYIWHILHWARARKGLQNYSWLFIMGAFCVTTQNQDKWKIFIVNTRNMQHLIDHLFHFQQEPHMPKRLDKQYCPLQISLCANILRANIRHTVCKYQPAQANGFPDFTRKTPDTEHNSFGLAPSPTFFLTWPSCTGISSARSKINQLINVSIHSACFDAKVVFLYIYK